MSEVVTEFDLPESWEWSDLETVSRVGAGNPAPQGDDKFENGAIPFVRVKDMGKLDGQVKIRKVGDYVNEKGAKGLRLVKSGAILFTKSGASTLLNQRAILGQDSYVVSHIAIAEPYDGVLSEWVYYWMTQIDFGKLAHGANMPSLPLSKAKVIPVPLAPLEQQKRIVAKIEELFSHIDAGIEALNKAKQLLKQYRQSVLKAAVTGELTKEWREQRMKDDVQGSTSAAGAGSAGAAKLEPASHLLERILKERRQKWEEQQLEQFKTKGKMPKNDKWKEKYKEPKQAVLLVDIDNPAEWEMTSIDEVAEVFLGKMLDKSKHTKGQKLPYLRNINVRWGSVDTDDVSEMFFKDDELERYNLESGDVLVCEGGVPGRASVWYGEIENMKYQKALHRVRFYLPLNPEYLALLLEYFASTGLLSRYFTGSTIKHFTKESFTTLPFPLPSLAEMGEIVGLVDEKILSIQRLESEIEISLLRAEKNKQSILASAFSGTLK